MLKDPIKITCPNCKNILIINAQESKIIEIRKPIIEESTGDRLQDALLKVKKRQDEVDLLFQKAKEKEKGKKSRFDAVFKESIEKAEKDDTNNPPIKEMDL